MYSCSPYVCFQLDYSNVVSDINSYTADFGAQGKLKVQWVLIRSGSSSREYTNFYIEKFDKTLWEESIEWLNGHPGHGLGCRKNF